MLTWRRHDAYALVSDPPAFTIAKILCAERARYELWDVRKPPAALIGWHASADAAKAEAAKLSGPADA